MRKIQLNFIGGGGTAKSHSNRKSAARLIFAVLLCVMLIGSAFFAAYAFDTQTSDAMSTAATVNIGSITNSHYATNSGIKVFNGDKLKDLYEQLTGDADATYQTVKNMADGGNRNSAYFRSLNGGNDILLDFGGLTWTPVYLFKGADGNSVNLTLFAEDIITPSKFSGHSTSNAQVTYPANMYGTSYVRAVTLNNGGGYASGQSTLTPYNQSASSVFAKFTMPKTDVADSLTEYITKPANADYQKIGAFIADQLCNDYWNGYTNANNSKATLRTYYFSNARYGFWQNDYLWCPSWAETGRLGYESSTSSYSVGCWALSANQTKASNNYLLRTGNIASNSDGVNIRLIGNNGIQYVREGTNTYNVRPALHLNLTLADRDSNAVTKPELTGSHTYNGLSQQINFSTLSGFDTDTMKVSDITLKDAPAGAVTPTHTDTTVNFTTAGTYKVTLKTKTKTIGAYSESYTWRDTGTDQTEIEFTVDKKKLFVPSFATSSESEIFYNGLEQTFKLQNYPSTQVPETGTCKYPVNPLSILSVSQSVNGSPTNLNPLPSNTANADGTLTIKLTDSGEYTVTFAIADKVNYVWSDDTQTDKTASFKIKKKQLELPKFSNTSDGEKTYDGTTQTFVLQNYPSTAVLETTDCKYPVNPLTLSSVERKINGKTSAVTLANTANADGTLRLEIRNAGEYTVKFSIADKDNYEWKSGGQDDKTVLIKVKQKDLSLSYASSAPNGAVSWSSTDDYSIVFKISGAVKDVSQGLQDSINVKLLVTKEADLSFTTIESVATYDTVADDGSYTVTLGKSLFADSKYSVGAYPITFEIVGNGADDDNYTLANALTAIANLKLVVVAANAGSDPDAFVWKYVKYKDGVAQGAAAELPSNLQYSVYDDNGVLKSYSYKLTLDEATLAVYHMTIDKTKYADGYKDNEASAVGNYTAVVALKADDGYEFKLPNGTTSATMDYTLKWMINKLSVDMSGVKWQYVDANGTVQDYPADGLPWKGTNYTLTLTNLPAGVTVNTGAGVYENNQGKYVGNYTAKCLGLKYDTNNFETISAPTLEWKITKLKIEITDAMWKTDETPEGEADKTKVFMLPHLNHKYDGKGIVYEYYYLGTKDVPIAAQKLNSIDEILVENGTERNYYVKAVLSDSLSDDTKNKWSEVLELVDNTSSGDFTRSFTTGDSRTPISVTMSDSVVTYDGNAHGVLGRDIRVTLGSTDNDLSQDNFTIKYYAFDEAAQGNKGAPLGDGQLPMAAGKYVIEVVLTDAADVEYYLTVTSMTLEIQKYQIDMSGVRWGYLDADGNEHVYNPSIPLAFEVKTDENGNPVFVEGKPQGKEQKVILVGFPKGDEQGDDEDKVLAKMFAASGLGNAGTITYTGNVSSAVTGNNATYQAHYVLDESFIDVNFELIGMPSATDLPTTLDWRIDPHKITKPVDNSTTFNAETIDLLTLVGLDASELDVYYKVTALVHWVDGTPFTLAAADIANIKDAGDYDVTFSLIDGANTRWNDNGILKQSAQKVRLSVGKLEITVVDWDDVNEGAGPWEALFADTIPDGLYTNRYCDAQGNVITDDWSVHYLETLTQTLTATQDNENNIVIKFADGVDTSKQFTLGDDPQKPAGILTKPQYQDGANNGSYIGKEKDYAPDGLKQLVEQGRVKLFVKSEDEVETEVTLQYFKQTEVGEYKVIVRIDGPYKWADTDDKSDVEYAFTIAASQLPVEWSIDDGGKPVATLGNEYNHLDSALQYHFYNADGEEVAENQLVADAEYTVTVGVKQDYTSSFSLVDADEKGEVTSPDKYIAPKGFFEQEFLGLPIWVWFIILLVLIAIIVLAIVFGRKYAKAKALKKAEAEKLAAEEAEKKAVEEAQTKETEVNKSDMANKPETNAVSDNNGGSANVGSGVSNNQTVGYAQQPNAQGEPNAMEQQLLAQQMQMQQQMMA
ncbi:MAG: hypothetical protein NC350_05570, partial [Corallococcus sp.]|nr:hypothetical protein [Corallococcus sp.]